MGVTGDLISTGRDGQPGPFHHASWEQSSQGHQTALAPAPAIGHFPDNEAGQRLGYGKLETSPVEASWGQGLMAPRDWRGVLCCRQGEGEISGKLG